MWGALWVEPWFLYLRGLFKQKSPDPKDFGTGENIDLASPEHTAGAAGPGLLNCLPHLWRKSTAKSACRQFTIREVSPKCGFDPNAVDIYRLLWCRLRGYSFRNLRDRHPLNSCLFTCTRNRPPAVAPRRCFGETVAQSREVNL